MRSPRAVLAALCILFIYLLFLTKTYYWDGVLFSFYTEQVHRGEMTARALLHANHLLYTPLGYLLATAVWPFARSLRAIVVFQALNAVCSVCCAWLVFQLARRSQVSETIAWFAMLLFAFGATWWKFSTDADPYILSVLFCLAAIHFSLRGSIVGATTCHVAAMLIHQLAVFLYFPILVAFLLPQRRWRAGLLYVFVSANLVIAAYAAAYAVVPHTGDQTFSSWITSYAGDTPVTHSLHQIVSGYLGSYLKLFAGGKLSLVRQFLGPVVLASLLLCVAFVAVAFWLGRKPEGATERTSVYLPVWIAWFVPLACFLAVFDPASTFHKLLIWPPLVLLLCALVPRRRARSFVALAAALAAWNFGAFIWPHSHESADPVLPFAHQIDRELPPRALIYYQAFSPDDWYLRYFGQRHAWKQIPVPSDAKGPLCLETTAFNALPEMWRRTHLRWTLVSPQHDIRVGCIDGP